MTHIESGKSADLLTVAQTAKLLAISERSVWRLLATGTLRRVRIGRAVRVRHVDIHALVERGGAR